jgi:putative 4-mercaptohistidine N1-methyltranferase
MSDLYESDKMLGEYLLFHYGKANQVMPWDTGPVDGLNFPVRSVVELLDTDSLRDVSNSNALDVGCSVGRSTFELSKYCDEVCGCDLSKSFIEAAKKIGNEKMLEFSYLDEGDNYISTEASVTLYPGKKVSFSVADACSLPLEFKSYDVVHAANLICRLPKPFEFINRLPELVSPGGQLLLATPFTWLSEYTPRENWIGSGDSEEKLKDMLSPYFDLEKKVELPFVIREHKRKYQYSVSLGTRWRRKGEFK